MTHPAKTGDIEWTAALAQLLASRLGSPQSSSRSCGCSGLGVVHFQGKPRGFSRNNNLTTVWVEKWLKTDFIIFQKSKQLIGAEPAERSHELLSSSFGVCRTEGLEFSRAELLFLAWFGRRPQPFLSAFGWLLDSQWMIKVVSVFW